MIKQQNLTTNVLSSKAHLTHHIYCNFVNVIGIGLISGLIGLPAYSSIILFCYICTIIIIIFFLNYRNKLGFDCSFHSCLVRNFS